MHDCASLRQTLMDDCWDGVPVDAEGCAACAEWIEQVETALGRIDEALDATAPAVDFESKLRARIGRRAAVTQLWFGAAALAAAAGLAALFVVNRPPLPADPAIPHAAIPAAVLHASRPVAVVEHRARPEAKPVVLHQAWAINWEESGDAPEKPTADAVRELMGFDEKPIPEEKEPLS